MDFDPDFGVFFEALQVFEGCLEFGLGANNEENLGAIEISFGTDLDFDEFCDNVVEDFFEDDTKILASGGNPYCASGSNSNPKYVSKTSIPT